MNGLVLKELHFHTAHRFCVDCRSISYKEQARLNQAACNALMARLDCQKMTCEAAEKDLLQRYSQREALAALVKPDFGGTTQKKPLRGRDIVDVSSCLSLVTTNDGQIVTPEKGFPHGDMSMQNTDDEIEDDGSLSFRSQSQSGISLGFSFSEMDTRQQDNKSRDKGKGEHKAVTPVRCQFLSSHVSCRVLFHV